MIETLYLISGLILPLFYGPQVSRLLKDESRLESFSLLKSLSQLILRLPALLFAFMVIHSPYMNIVLSADVLGRLMEFVVAIISLRRQGLSYADISDRIVGGVRGNVETLQRRLKIRRFQKRRAQRARQVAATLVSEQGPATVL